MEKQVFAIIIAASIAALIPTSEAAAYNCTTYGRYAITTDTTCQSYYLCFPEDDGTYTVYNETCPTTTLFDPTTANCVNSSSYTCTNGEDSTTTEATETTTTAAYDCTTYGRYAITTDTTCQSYYLCFPEDDGTYTRYNETCPTTTVFDPTVAKCVNSSAYTCTNDGTTTDAATTTDSATTTDAATTTDSATTIDSTTTTDATTTTVAATTTAAATTTEAATTTIFACTAYGRYAITTDTTCKTYYFCTLNSDGSFTMEEFTCPTTTIFNPTKSKCVAPSAYTCTN